MLYRKSRIFNRSTTSNRAIDKYSSYLHRNLIQNRQIESFQIVPVGLLVVLSRPTLFIFVKLTSKNRLDSSELLG